MKGGRQPVRCRGAAAHLADDGGGADDRDGSAGGGNRRVLAVQPAAGHRVVPGTLIKQDFERLGIAVLRPPAGLAQCLAVDDPRIDDVMQLGDGRGREPGPVQALRCGERQGRRQLDAPQARDFLELLLLEPAVAANGERPP